MCVCVPPSKELEKFILLGDWMDNSSWFEVKLLKDIYIQVLVYIYMYRLLLRRRYKSDYTTSLSGPTIH